MGTSLTGTGTLGSGPDVGLGPFILRYPSRFLSTTCGYGTSLFCISTPPPSLDVVSSLIPLSKDFHSVQFLVILNDGCSVV